ncbi:universal stress protein [Anaerobacillus alkalilacustris]|uniref:Universal stress protein n=1 Tax=Anaerobacillus alkalilacustris TaxID=393763 RepID=A0A1S2LXJ7_9BACI|nr:universal stress protein [Anaerobacillus alkalilacustris]OIJ17066.1 universal stress protein [Anaerobacillus alkalilacustris]
MFKKILLAADGSEHSIRAAEKALAISKTSNESSIEVIYVIDGSTSKSDVLSNFDVKAITEQRKAKLRPIEELLVKDDISHKFHLVHGEPGPTIVKFANENQYDLVVIGSRGLNTLQEMVLGSVSHKVAKRANCPVMIVK